MLADWIASGARRPADGAVMTCTAGIVRSASDFGYRHAADAPRAARLAGQRVAVAAKPLHRDVHPMSATPPSALHPASRSATADPENDRSLLAVRAAAARSILAVSGNSLSKAGREGSADLGRGGRPVRLVAAVVAEDKPRSVYVHIKRSLSADLVVDAADADCSVRFTTTQPTLSPRSRRRLCLCHDLAPGRAPRDARAGALAVGGDTP